jgi:hypothetical protein
METIQIDILNPKAKILLKDLANINLIRISKVNEKSGFIKLLKNLRMNAEMAPSIEEISSEIENVRKIRYEK